MEYVNNLLELVGNTPLIKLNKLAQSKSSLILLKLESQNPGGSVKDRIGLAMIEAAEKEGAIKPGGTIVEPTAGNTGVGLAIAAAIKGYKLIFTMPDKMSQEKILLLKAYGAEVVICPTAVPPDSPESYYEVAKRIVSETPNSFMPNQYFNQANPHAHYKTTGPEIWRQTEGKISYFIAGMGTGGTITGTARYLKEQNTNVKIIGVDTEGSIFSYHFYKKPLKKGDVHPFLVEGIGEDIIPGTVDFSLIDEVITISDKEAFLTARDLAKYEALLVGSSAGCAVAAALKVAERAKDGEVIVALMPDTGRNYLSKYFDDDWMEENIYLPERIKNEAEFIRTIYEKTAEEYDRIISKSRYHHFISLISELGLKGDERVADFGSGPGTLSLETARRVPRGRVTGIDFSENMVKLAAEKAKLLNLENVVFVTGDVSKLKLRPKSLDVAISSMVIHLVSDTASFLSNMNAALKQGGTLGIIAPGENIYREFRETFGALVKKYARYFGTTDYTEILHITMRTEREYERLLAEYGFSTRKMFSMETKESVRAEDYIRRMNAYSNERYLSKLPEHIKTLFKKDLLKRLSEWSEGDLKATEAAILILAEKTKEAGLSYEI